jgi:transcription-repair coupling factor (superfamily II helicase)
VRFGPVELPDSAQVRLNRLYPGSMLKPAAGSVLVPRPMTARVAGQPLRDTAVLRWAADFVDAVLLGQVAAAAGVATR